MMARIKRLQQSLNSDLGIGGKKTQTGSYSVWKSRDAPVNSPEIGINQFLPISDCTGDQLII